ncbi:MAG: polymer-forming cytoskeletal protein [Rhodospirillaceae bacterium]|jgi:cytoskeletal protein CcmA (bactofilin family)|nr:polymer-forming cytoskeletal protein [Rhodospirillaceae bacterium]
MFSKGKGKSKSDSGRKRKPVPPTIISADIRITGNVTSEGEVQVDGTVDGDVRGAKVSVGASGHIAGAVSADRILVRGKVNGQIRAQVVTLTRSSEVRGDVFHDTLSMEPGAKLEGHCRRLNAVDTEEGANINLVVSDGLAARTRKS